MGENHSHVNEPPAAALTPHTIYRARWIIPGDRPPLENGFVAVAGDRIVAVGGGEDPCPWPPGDGASPPATQPIQTVDLGHW